MDSAIPELTTDPITRRTLALFAGASGDHNPIHIDLDFAQEAGMGDVFAHGMLSMAYLGRMLTNWIPQSALREFRVRFTAITHVHDRIRCTGRIVERFERGGEKLARLELEAADQDGEVKVAGEAVVAL
jgi:acyl dehydratase